MTFIENKKSDIESKDRHLYNAGTFSQFTYWNYDKIPSKNDTLAAALDWIDIAEVVSNYFMINYCFLTINEVLIILNNFQLHSPET